jgi:hypothetical protein
VEGAAAEMAVGRPSAATFAVEVVKMVERIEIAMNVVAEFVTAAKKTPKHR